MDIGENSITQMKKWTTPSDSWQKIDSNEYKIDMFLTLSKTSDMESTRFFKDSAQEYFVEYSPLKYHAPPRLGSVAPPCYVDKSLLADKNDLHRFPTKPSYKHQKNCYLSLAYN